MTGMSSGVTGYTRCGGTRYTAPSAAISLKGLLKDKGAVYLTPPQICDEVHHLIRQHQRLMNQIRDDCNGATSNPLVILDLRLRNNPIHCDGLYWRLRGSIARHFAVPKRSVVDLYGDSEPMFALRNTFVRQLPNVWPLIPHWESVRLSAMLRAKELTQFYARWHALCEQHAQRASLGNVSMRARDGRKLCEHYGLDFVAALPL